MFSQFTLQNQNFICSMPPDIIENIFSFLRNEKSMYSTLMKVRKDWRVPAHTVFRANSVVSIVKRLELKNTIKEPLRKKSSLIPRGTGEAILPVVDPDYLTGDAFPYVLTIQDLMSSQNEYICELKSFGWTYTKSHEGKQFDCDIDRQLMVNKLFLRSLQVEEYAKKFPLIEKYRRLHTQEVTYLFNNAISVNLYKGQFFIIRRNYSANILITDRLVQCITDNDLLLATNLSVPAGKGKLFLIPGHIQTVFEMIDKPQPGLKLKVIKTSNSVLRDLIFKNFSTMNDDLLEEMTNKAKNEESMNSLYEWYKQQAKFFLGDKFYRDYSHVDCDAFVKNYLLEVKKFLELYSEPKPKYREFIEQTSLFFKEQKEKIQELERDTSLNSLAKPKNNEDDFLYRPSKKYQFFLTLYALLKGQKKADTIPLPLPTAGLDEDENLYIIFPSEAIKFKITLIEYNRRLFNQVFSKVDEEGNCMALFKHANELVDFLVKCEMDPHVAKILAVELHEELGRDSLWQELVEVRESWEKFMHEVASAFNLVIPSKSERDEVFQKSPERKALLEKAWRSDYEKRKSDMSISPPLLGNGMYKPSLLEIFKIRMNARYKCGCASVSLVKSGLTISLKHVVNADMQIELKKFNSIEYIDDGYKVKMSSWKDIEQFSTSLSISFEALAAEVKLNLAEVENTQDECCVM